MSDQTAQVDRWTLRPPRGSAGPFWGVVKQSGRVIALQILEREHAEILRIVGNVLAGDIETVKMVTDCADSIFDDTLGPMMLEPKTDYLVGVIVEAILGAAKVRE